MIVMINAVISTVAKMAIWPHAPKRPRGTNQLAKLIVDISTGEANDVSLNEAKSAGGDKSGTPAMEAKVSDHVWSLEEIAKLADLS